jgi:hypothetical protein
VAELTTLCICPHGDERHTIVRGPLRYCDSPFCGCFTDSAPVDAAACRCCLGRGHHFVPGRVCGDCDGTGREPAPNDEAGS